MRGKTAGVGAALVVTVLVLSIVAYDGAFLPRPGTTTTSQSSATTQSQSSTTTTSQFSSSNAGASSSSTGAGTVTSVAAGQTVLTQAELLAMAGTGYSNGGPIPVGDGDYTIQAPQEGNIDYCGTPPSGGGAQGSTPWIVNGSWYPDQKPHVEGNVSWPSAQFSDTISGSTRTLLGNGLPVGYPTGIFPIQKSDPAYQYDANPNSIQPHTIDITLPLDPVYLSTPHCVTPGMVGVMFNGVPLFDGMDAQQRDAAAHEVQDVCNGHPNGSDVYHYHDLSACFQDINETHILGYALDGFPITGPEVAPGHYLDSANLDVCHGMTSQILSANGTLYTTYHYVLTYDFPYSIGCFRGTPVETGNGNPIAAPASGQVPASSQSGALYGSWLGRLGAPRAPLVVGEADQGAKLLQSQAMDIKVAPMSLSYACPQVRFGGASLSGISWEEG